MHLQQEIDKNRLRIKSYSAGEIKINEDTYQQSVVLQADSVSLFESSPSFDSLEFEMLSALTAENPEILVIGTGPNFQLLPLTLQRQLEKAGIACEVMATREACHTWEVLSYEQRDVIALLFL